METDKISKENTDLKLSLIEDFSKFENSLNGSAGDGIHEIRKDAIAYINENGFPTKKYEDWKYTNPAHILSNQYKQIIGDAVATSDDIDVSEYVNDEDSNVLVFINGKFDSARSKIVSKGEGLFVGSFRDAYSKHSDKVLSYFARLAENDRGAFTAMNNAFANDGVFVFADKGVTINEPIKVIQIADARNEQYLIQPRNIFILGQEAKATISEEYFTLGDNPVLTNLVTEVYCGRNSKLKHYKIQNDGDNAYHVGSTYVKQEADSHYSNTTISWGGKIIRNNINAEYAGTNTECHFYGLYLLTDKQHVDNHTIADHAMPNCYSNELYKGIIADKATGVFNGRIVVRQDAQKTNAYQSNNTILLSDDAMNYSKPQLEIFADDVKCSHGATTGQLSGQEIFYLQTRGISEEEAKVILLTAFANDVIDTVKDEKLRAGLEHKLVEILRKAK